MKSYRSFSLRCSSRLSCFSCWAAAASYDTAPIVAPTVPIVAPTVPTASIVVPAAVLNAVQTVVQNVAT